MKLKIDAFNTASFDAAIAQLEKYKQDLKIKTEEIARRLAEMGAVRVSIDYSRAIYTGPKDINVSVESLGDGRYSIIASGETALIVEFGAGITYGSWHPEAGTFGMGVGTYPGQKHAFDPNGWWIPKGNTPDADRHTYGNPPSMTMYNTEKDLIREIERVAREVMQP